MEHGKQRILPLWERRLRVTVEIDRRRRPFLGQLSLANVHVGATDEFGCDGMVQNIEGDA